MMTRIVDVWVMTPRTLIGGSKSLEEIYSFRLLLWSWPQFVAPKPIIHLLDCTASQRRRTTCVFTALKSSSSTPLPSAPYESRLFSDVRVMGSATSGPSEDKLRQVSAFPPCLCEGRGLLESIMKTMSDSQRKKEMYHSVLSPWWPESSPEFRVIELHFRGVKSRRGNGTLRFHCVWPYRYVSSHGAALWTFFGTPCIPLAQLVADKWTVCGRSFMSHF
jgi:hypothetical protein